MSFNFLEIARATADLQSLLPDEVQSIELVRFPLQRGTVPDLNIGLRLKNSRKMVVFSLKQPWTGMLVMAPNCFAPVGAKGTKPSWAGAFSGSDQPAQEWDSYIHGVTLERAEVAEGERIVKMSFANGVELRVELIPSRPNWVLLAGGVEIRWRTSLPPRPGGAAGLLTLREFEGAQGSWMERAYQHYLALRRAALVSAQLTRALQELQTRLSRLIKIRGQMEDSLSESAKADELQLQAEALKAILHELPRGQKSRRVSAWRLEGEQQIPIEVEVDPQYTVAENVTRMFARYKKLQRTKKEVDARLGGIEAESKKITGTIAKLRGFQGDFAALEELFRAAGLSVGETAVEARGEKKGDRKWRKATEKLGVRKFQSKEGQAIWVGRNHKENEELVIRLARGNDLWLHVKGRPGAHVVIQLPGGKSPSLETLLDAATLVAYYSGVSAKDKVEVDYTLRKYVKRVPGGGDEKFLVTYTQNKTLMLKMEEERLWRLLKQH